MGTVPIAARIADTATSIISSSGCSVWRPNPMLLALTALLAALIGGSLATVSRSRSRLNGHRPHRGAHR